VAKDDAHHAAGRGRFGHLLDECHTLELHEGNTIDQEATGGVAVDRRGENLKETATLMGISTRTAESHKYEVMRLLGVKTTAALNRYALRIKLI
jgi:hypothetical protein